ncbi:MAG TPA: ABC transporter substrate-binding protein [Streptosporangiaceae bacterium]|jgi:peptide/nickel transport system substrate-binding protein|nr:ABC transporter substrate-binding protein [Streptosporangiaceae bacterium]
MVVAAAGCTGSTPATSTAAPGGTVTFGLVAGTQPNYIFPFRSLTYFSVYNAQYFQYLMYRPLYVFGDNGTSVSVNYPLSPADAPVYSDGGKNVLINLKGWKWSNGETVDAKDVVFWLHMMSAEFANWGGATPGGIPKNIRSISVTGADQVTLRLTRAYSSLWYTYNELSQITPMPMAWDVTTTGAAPGSGGCTTDTAADHWAKCKAVYNFLAAQSKDSSGYAASPIWSVVSGPFKLASFSPSGADTFAVNPKYSGSPKPRISTLKYLPYTSQTTEYTGVSSGQADIGQIAPQDLPVKTGSPGVPSTNPLASAGYYLKPFYDFGFDYYVINWSNPTYGPVFKQLYFRQALEHLADQPAMATTIYRGYGYPTTGAVPTLPANKWTPAVQNAGGPYPFSVSTARSLLVSHGWSPVGGVMTCTDPSKCGAGVAKGVKLNLNLVYTSGDPAFTDETDVYKSDAAKAGINLTVTSQSFNAIISETVPSNHSWQMGMYGGWSYGLAPEPTGGQLFTTGAGANGGQYSNPAMNKLITETETSSSLSVFHNYAAYAAQQLPFIYMPNTYEIMAVKNNLHNVEFSPLYWIFPEYWSFTK